MTVENPLTQGVDADRPDPVSNAVVASLPVLAALLYFVVAVRVLLAGHLHEDAYILFTYVENLARGDGFAFYAGGPPAEGATDFLWTVALAAAYRLGIDPGITAAALNALGIAVLCLVSIRFIPAGVGPRMRPVLAICVTVLVTVSPIASAGIGGFSGPLFAAIVVLLFSAYLHGRHGVLPWGGLLLGLIRPDGVIIGAGYALLGLVDLWRQGGRRRYLVHLVLAGTIGCAYFAWRVSYFGHLLPLPLYVKNSGLTVFPGVAPNLNWLTITLPLVALAATVVLHDSVDRRRLGLAILPILLLLAGLCFARQMQNIDYRFQAPATAVAIVIATLAAGHWIQRSSHVVASAAVICGLAMSLPVYGTMLVLNIRYFDSAHYDNYLPYYLAAVTDRNTTIALTEAGRMAYWTNGTKIDLIGLNTPYPAIHGLDLAYLERVQPDLLFIDTARTLSLLPRTTAPFVAVTVDDIRRNRRMPLHWIDEAYPIRRAPLVVFDYLERHPDAFDIVMVGQSNGFRHLYAIRKGGALAYADFIAALRKSLSPEGRLSYWEMKQQGVPPR
jgi:hypothetical protein